MKDLDAAGLDCLAALADERSFERAAETLAITQSAVSQRLRSLEAQVGQLLVVRSRPLRLTDPGKRLLRYARQLAALRSDVVRELGVQSAQTERLPIAVNADSLATWVLPALDPLVQRGMREGFGLELVVDDQDFTHDWLRQGEVLGCVTTVPQALRGCIAQPLGVMRYIAVASPDFAARMLPNGLGAANFAQVPFLVFNRKDDAQQQWVRQAMGLRSARLNARYVPSSEGYVNAVRMGWGWAWRRNCRCGRCWRAGSWWRSARKSRWRWPCTGTSGSWAARPRRALRAPEKRQRRKAGRLRRCWIRSGRRWPGVPGRP
ncbi:LysR family transcriptional regulator ArgP [Roseateles chitinivorans]|uniref:LysR family transcriptional regulator ArgP n=1 Tax=Roseateles chitinivorans TaxID=2917965 RepID=UPI003D67CB89